MASYFSMRKSPEIRRFQGFCVFSSSFGFDFSLNIAGLLRPNRYFMHPPDKGKGNN